jgi:riboflavin transporter FmnP
MSTNPYRKDEMAVKSRDRAKSETMNAKVEERGSLNPETTGAKIKSYDSVNPETTDTEIKSHDPVKPDTMNARIESRNTAKLVKMGLMLAIAVVCSFVRFPVLPSVPFIEYELSDLPLLIAGLAFGTLPGLILVICCVLLDAVIAGAGGGPYGMIMQFIAIGTYVVVTGLIYQRNKTRRTALIGLVCGVIVMTAAMIPANLIVTPAFMGVPVDAVKALIVPAIIPVNLIKGAISAVATFFIYKKISPFLHR